MAAGLEYIQLFAMKTDRQPIGKKDGETTAVINQKRSVMAQPVLP